MAIFRNPQVQSPAQSSPQFSLRVLAGSLLIAFGSNGPAIAAILAPPVVTPVVPAVVTPVVPPVVTPVVPPVVVTPVVPTVVTPVVPPVVVTPVVPPVVVTPVVPPVVAPVVAPVVDVLPGVIAPTVVPPILVSPSVNFLPTASAITMPFISGPELNLTLEGISMPPMMIAKSAPVPPPALVVEVPAPVVTELPAYVPPVLVAPRRRDRN